MISFYKPQKQKSVRSIMSTQRFDVFGVLESKFDQKVLGNLMWVRFAGMFVIHNFNFSSKVAFCLSESKLS